VGTEDPVGTEDRTLTHNAAVRLPRVRRESRSSKKVGSSCIGSARPHARRIRGSINVHRLHSAGIEPAYAAHIPYIRQASAAWVSFVSRP
jgi:hypothetical protein